MKHKLFHPVVFAMLLLSMALAACAPAATATPAEPVEPQPAEATTAPVEAATEAPATEPTAEPVEAAISGTITVLTNRTDIVDTVFVEYAKEFNKIYPDVTVEFEALRDYAGEVQIRMNTTDYGDVLLIPEAITLDKLADYFEPLGTVEDLDPKYNFVPAGKSYNGQVYGIAMTGNFQGIACNKNVFEAAGIAANPKTPEEFVAAMQSIKDKTDAIPLYTNYAAGWPMTQWEGQIQSVSGDPDYTSKMAHLDAPFAPGTPHYTTYKLLFDLVKNGLTEEDPTTTDWETSKQLIADGQVGCMVTGSWSIVQYQEKAQDPGDIIYIPFPSNINGQQYAAAGGDYNVAVNKNSKNKAAALAWLWWFLDKSNYAYDQGGIPPLKSAELPSTLDAFKAANVMFVANNPAPAGEESFWGNIDKEAEIGLWTEKVGQRIIDAARGASDETFDDIMNDLNAKWAAARAKLGIK